MVSGVDAPALAMDAAMDEGVIFCSTGWTTLVVECACKA